MRSVWDTDETGVTQLPSGRLLRGRDLHEPIPSGATPDFALYLLGKSPAPVKCEGCRVLRPDFRLSKDRDDARDALHEAWVRSEAERVEIACAGGHGRTGTALACIALFDGVPADKAMTFIRKHYNPRAV